MDWIIDNSTAHCPILLKFDTAYCCSLGLRRTRDCENALMIKPKMADDAQIGIF